ncbi:MAG: beta-ketoacyl synthase chain length factor [Treponema sp.]|jgi:hypothetical protein|nr:beta-ketoacyl synthase chain length factor [Treponema sp.]
MKRFLEEGNGRDRHKLFVSRFSAWAPGLSGRADWKEWALNRREIPRIMDGPALEFASPLFRRRLSQISRMTIQVLHDLSLPGKSVKVVFLSFRGEISRQLEINRMLIQEGDLTPAAFSLSVFNTPPALATIALGLTAGYSAVYPGQNRFEQGFLAGAAPVLCGAGETAFVYADELCPPEYGDLCPAVNQPLAFAVLLSLREEGIPVAVPRAGISGNPDIPEYLKSPGEFLKYLYRMDGRS